MLKPCVVAECLKAKNNMGGAAAAFQKNGNTGAQSSAPAPSYGSQPSYGFQPYGNNFAPNPQGYSQPQVYGQQQSNPTPPPYQPFNLAFSNNYNVQSPDQVTTPYAPIGSFGGPASYGMGPGNAGFGFGNGATRVPDTDIQTAGQFNPSAMQPQMGNQTQMNTPQGGLPMFEGQKDRWGNPMNANPATTAQVAPNTSNTTTGYV